MYSTYLPALNLIPNVRVLELFFLTSPSRVNIDYSKFTTIIRTISRRNKTFQSSPVSCFCHLQTVSDSGWTGIKILMPNYNAEQRQKQCPGTVKSKYCLTNLPQIDSDFPR